MCSIPGLPTSGSEVPVLITRVNLNPSTGLVEVWVNLDDDRKHIYEQMREEIQTTKRTFVGSEGNPGDLCLVSMGDAWHRARIVSIQSETYDVFLIDQGHPHNATCAELAWGQSESFLLPPETEFCILANIVYFQNNWPEIATKFLVSLPGKKFKGLVQDVLTPDRTILLDVPVVFKYLCKIGVAKKIPADEFKCVVQKCLGGERTTQAPNLNVGWCLLEKQDQYFYPELSSDTFESVTVTEGTDPSYFFCKLQIFSKAVMTLLEQIQQHYEESSDFGEMPPLTCGDPCAARGINGQWRRSLLKRTITSNGAVEVLHVDEGKVEFIPVGDIRPLLGKFLRMPVFTYPCCLEGVMDTSTGWTTDQNEYLKSLLLHQTLTAKFKYRATFQDVYNVTLYADDACINNRFIEKAGLPVNEPIPSLFLGSHGDQHYMDLQNKIINGLREETLPSVNGRTDDVLTLGADDTQTKGSYELPDPLEHITGSFQTGSESPDPLKHTSRHFPSGSELVDLPEHISGSFPTGSELVDPLEHISGSFPTSSEITDPLGHTNGHFPSSSVLPDHLEHTNRHFPTGFPSEVPNACNDGVFKVGSSVDVKVSFIESQQKFWCQPMENGDSLTLLMKNLQDHYASAYPQPLVESIFVARNPDNNKWYRARIMASQHSPVVDVRYIDYGQTRTVPLRDVRPIDPMFLRLDEQAFQCCLMNPQDATNPAWTDVVELQKFVCLSNAGLKCNIKAVMSDEDGLLLNVVNIETPSDGAYRSQECPKAEALVPLDTYNYSTHDIEVNTKEKVWVTYSQNVNQFYCQLDKNLCLFDKLVEDVKRHIDQPQCTDHPLGLNSICLARHTDDHWYRSKIVEMCPELKVHFVDYGRIVTMNKSDIRPFPNEASLARSVPVQAIPLGLFEVPEEVPQEVNKWFSDTTTGQSFTISVRARGETGKLIVELFDGPLDVNGKVRAMVSKMAQQHMANQQLTNGSEPDRVLGEETQELMNGSGSPKMENLKVHNINGACSIDEPSPQSTTHASVPGTALDYDLDEERKPTLDVIMDKEKESCPSEITQLSGNVNTSMSKFPNISEEKEVYASCIVGPHYFWCQYADTEMLNKVSRLTQEAGRTEQDPKFPDSLGPGSPCLALFSSDNQWYRSQVIRRTDDAFSVLFIDYGNESDVEVKNVRSLPQRLLDVDPQAFLCSLKGFDESRGSWADEVYDEFYNAMVDKPLRLTVFHLTENSEAGVPQFTVDVQCQGAVVNTLMKKYWKPAVKERSSLEHPERETVQQHSQTESNTTKLNISEENVNTYMYKMPNLSKTKKELVYASVIVEPKFFWCQYADPEMLNKVSKLSQGAGRTPWDPKFPDSLGPGSPCLALYYCDKRWYRAQVIRRMDNVFRVLFIDYGEESDIDVKNVRAIPQRLLDVDPQAFLCSLKGFDESRGSWTLKVCNDFHKLLADKPLKLTAFHMKYHPEAGVPQYAVEIECQRANVNAAMQKYWKPAAKEQVSIEHPERPIVLQDSQTKSNTTKLNIPKGNVNTCMYKCPNISEEKEVYASCIGGPHYFWCQYADTMMLNKVSRLTQESGQTEQDPKFPDRLGPGSPCLALFSSDNQWYRSQVIRRTSDVFSVLFIDYGNESDVDVKNVRSLPQRLLDVDPQAFLCSLKGFDESRGSWADEVYDEFYNTVVDKPLRLTLFHLGEHSEAGVPQFTVEVQCQGAVVNTLMKKYWKESDKGRALREHSGSALGPDQSAST